MKKPSAPTRSELRLLQQLWAHGPSTVRDVHERVKDETDVSYTTVLKQLQIMHEKGLVSRETSSRAHCYKAAVEQQATRQNMLDDFLNRVYQGSAAELVVQALGLSRPASREELEEIEKTIQLMKAQSDSGDKTPREN
ncbi:BlaI/MecI/CopY family transcriptional regulator [Natronospira bacteriovora]|uniref:BlaI/MecI/CopY family transcriptional regulator n=1 Tax=Natronospira bacteriovora TaxID=3069753 RepID=A0ABU0W3H9_9GAMM|nr:BlaI/MecI/CopY family transcriptional regulator [Natronospira sp. AB-CW4]MDQ2068572.1 BlaI/MecI/CopY family transcriptional regulator [Natronospira sp. AB-CW4]